MTHSHEMTDSPAYVVVGDWSGPVVATSIHTGHELRPEVAEAMKLDEAVRFREEDPFTDRIIRHLPDRLEVRRSRFEVDLNRDRDGSVYRSADGCWGLDVWHSSPLDEAIAERSREEHDVFYEQLGLLLDPLAERGPFVLFDCHSYNHRRDGADHAPEPQQDNPDVNVGTGSLDREHFGDVVDAFINAMSEVTINGTKLDVRENVKFKGAHLARWAHERYPGVACVLALEFKKTFMDEWTGQPNDAHIETLAEALRDSVNPVMTALAGFSTPRMLA